MSSNLGKKPKPRRPAPGVRQMVAGPGPTITTENGTVWRMSYNHQDAKAALEQFVHDHVVLEAVRTKRRLGGKDGQDHYDAVQDRIDNQHYLTMEAGWLATLKGEAGDGLFLASLLAESHPTVTPAQARELFEAESEQVRAAIKVVAPDFFRHAVTAWLKRKGVPLDRAEAAVDGVMAEMRGFIDSLLGTSPTPPEPDTD